ncbi:hypothetical protein CUJ84_pRLN3000462 (plasmid) [Rhizobium leguminosarum]|uniref:Fumarylacetoacetase-like C-terminal domain-containing protein n=1 Tax=Rhizobium leguminosarum TaxID=384 RepID=A0A2K9ZH63_RHILE|nr:hypothetical protein CUJ84_pRLN3000462 [Rhizobium leguminosarum]
MNGPAARPASFFTKPADAVVGDGETVAYPPETENFHYEAELVVAIGKTGRDILEEDALSHIWGYAVGNDLTRRDLQLKARDQGRPWNWRKAFGRSALIGPCAQGERGRPSGKRRHSPHGERRGETGRRSLRIDLVCSRNYLDLVPVDDAKARRLDHDRHVGRRRSHGGR